MLSKSNLLNLFLGRIENQILLAARRFRVRLSPCHVVHVHQHRRGSLWGVCVGVSVCHIHPTGTQVSSWTWNSSFYGDLWIFYVQGSSEFQFLFPVFIFFQILLFICNGISFSSISVLALCSFRMMHSFFCSFFSLIIKPQIFSFVSFAHNSILWFNLNF